jgi:hypothetical protein
MTFMDILLCWSTFHHCDKTPEINNLKEEEFILVFCFRGFSSRSAGFIALDLSETEYHGDGSVVEDSAYLIMAGKQRKRTRKKLGTKCTLQSHALSNFFPPNSPNCS